MDPFDASALARRLMDEHGLTDWSFRFNRRKRALGLCVYVLKRIELSWYFVRCNDEAAVRDTVLHEIAHALAGHAAGHGPKWKAACRRVGARPERCDRSAAMPRGRWQATCPRCGQSFHRHRRPLRDRAYCCRRCGREAGRLTFELAAGAAPTAATGS
jgi:predicted SprT family Zn-dependent metalloprotease